LYGRPKNNIPQRIVANVLDSLDGLKIALKEGGNFHTLFPLGLLIGVPVGLILGFTPGEWAISLFLFLMIVSFEIMNNAIEKTNDVISEDYNDKIKQAKNMASMAVFVWIIVCIVVVLFFAICHLTHWPWWKHMF